jgi:hypothetical protein
MMMIHVLIFLQEEMAFDLYANFKEHPWIASAFKTEVCCCVSRLADKGIDVHIRSCMKCDR